jgi:hypothetical protein
MTTTKVNSEFIAVNAISGTIIADGAITSTHLAANSVDSSELVTGSIDTIHIAANQVTATKIVTNGVLTRHISDDQVTADKLANSINTDIATGPAALPKAGGTMTGNLTVNAIVDADNFKINNAQGSDGQVLTSTGSGVAWEDAAGTTINNNADNRIITGSGTANTLEGEANLVFTGSNLGIGTSSPSGIIDAKTSSSGATLLSRLWNTEDSNSASNAEFRIVSGNAATPILTLGDSGAVRYSISSDTSDNLLFKSTGSTERMRIAGNNLFLNGGTDARIQLGTSGAGANSTSNDTVHIRGDGDSMKLMAAADGIYQFEVNGSEKLRIQTGGGISFNGDTAAANALDDYEEGTWTPAFYTYSGVTTSSITIYALYTKIGRICHIHAKITATLSSLPGQVVTITGLPFTAKDSGDTQQRSIIAIGGDTANTGGNTPKAHFRTSGTELKGIFWNASNNTAYWYYNSFDSPTFEIHIHGHYTTT